MGEDVLCLPGAGGQRRSNQPALRFVSKVVAVVLTLLPGAVHSARPAFVNDLVEEARQRGSGSILTGDPPRVRPDVDIIDAVEYDVLEMLKNEYDPNFACGYGGYGVYGYYGAWYGVYGIYNDDELLVDYTFNSDGYASLELTTDEYFERRFLKGDDDDENGFKMRPYIVNMADKYYEYDEIFSPRAATYFMYSGIGFATYYGYAPIYSAVYGGELVFTDESAGDRDSLVSWVYEQLYQETRQEAGEELEENKEEGDWSSKRLLDVY